MMAGERVLVVDDDAAILSLCRQILTADGWEVTLATRGEEALSRLEQEHYDLLLTDIRLSGMTGLDITRTLRQRGLDLTVITMTGYSNMEMTIQALSLGVDEFIVKPFSPGTLRIHIKRALDKTRMRGENARLRALVPLLETAHRFAAARTRDDVVDEFVDAAGRLFSSTGIAFLLGGDAPEQLRFERVRGETFEPLRDSDYPLAQLDFGTSKKLGVWQQGRDPFPPAMPDANILLAFPVRLDAQLLGVLLASADAMPSASELEATQILASHAAQSLENVALVARLSAAYEDAVELERLKSDFIHIAGHELRTPLAAILGDAVLLQEHVPPELHELVLELMEQAQRLQRVADDMLSFQYLNEGPTELQLETFPVEQAVNLVVSAYQSLAVERNQSIETRIPADVGHLTADRAMVDLMLGSLLSNAVKFSPTHSTILVRANGEPDRVVIQVEDQGMGLSREQARHIFDPFYQADHSLTRRAGGLGFGLALTRAMVQAHRGQIWVESVPDSGSTFSIALPRSGSIGASPPP